ncbi:uncharacterized protein LOC115712485 [Cannabis sativa]|uniref:uncharacterized protein LOC115712485 n=1 Tax=Cannabis sativa TaxID=3483 RepID=UPI0029C9D2EB|nr:uncharacterized protein LOC115712485 [Cannabis sativa]XP_030496633.2 uncharacterized protein LOC115712485 [Cannabis sativa]XP_030496642.2 uncharacterized protein LOC115712485 [Cannabis sativa]XP_030496649.2 uncharacterized protein LOC115712485 [Cannabis sativa]XP_060961530.1 uncharacterized protein LOC115712485 [Cannabis sativa]
MDVSRWILEFLIRSPGKDRLAKDALSVMPVPNNDLRLNKIALLRTIEGEVSDAMVTETILEKLELVEALDSRQESGAAAMADSMKGAYCAVALECTVKFLVSGGGKPGEKYLNALNRVWRGRVRQLEMSGKSKLFTKELKRCWDEVEAAISDNSVCKKFLVMNTRNEAVRLVLEYLKEAWALLGPSFVEWAAKLTTEHRGLVRLGDGGVRSRGVESVEDEPEVGIERVDEEIEVQEPTAVKLASLGGGVSGMPELISEFRDQEDRTGTSKDQVCNKDEEIEVQEPTALKLASPGGGLSVSGMPELTSEFRDQEDRTGTSKDQVCNKDTDVDVTLPDSGTATFVKEIQSEKVVTRNKQVAINKRHRGRVRIAEDENFETNESENRNSISTPEVDRVREALKSSTSELQAVVTDPLPEASRVAEAVATDLATKNVSHENPLESQKGTEADATTNPCIEKNTNSNDPTPGNPSTSHQNNNPQPSLMARNSTAHTYEWDDSIDSIDDSDPRANASRLNPTRSKRKTVSALKKDESTKFTKRRKVKRWSLLEEDALRDGVKKYGKGNWKLILNTYHDLFEERTEVDLKDKWRNMTR